MVVYVSANKSVEKNVENEPPTVEKYHRHVELQFISRHSVETG